jgi:hypothetical protein
LNEPRVIQKSVGVPAHMGVGTGKSMQNAELIQLDRHLKKTAPFFANCACLKLGCAAGKKTLHREHGGGQMDLRWIE